MVSLEPHHREEPGDEEPGSTEEGEPGSKNPFVENQAVAQMDEPSFVETLRQPLEKITQYYGFGLHYLSSVLKRTC